MPRYLDIPPEVMPAPPAKIGGVHPSPDAHRNARAPGHGARPDAVAIIVADQAAPLTRTPAGLYEKRKRTPMERARVQKAKFQKALREQLMQGGVDMLAQAIAQGVLMGDPTCLKLAAEHIYGKPSQSVDVTSGGERINTAPTQVIMLGDQAVEFD